MLRRRGSSVAPGCGVETRTPRVTDQVRESRRLGAPGESRAAATMVSVRGPAWPSSLSSPDDARSPDDAIELGAQLRPARGVEGGDPRDPAQQVRSEVRVSGPVLAFGAAG